MARLKVVWSDIRNSLWFLPSLMTAAAMALAFGTVRVDQSVLADLRNDPTWLFGAGVEGARGVLSSIAGGIITVTGVVFSITVVALQLASTQFTPRILRSFMGDRINQTVLGVFIGTFTYTLMVLRTVRSAGEGGGTSPFVPSLSVTVAIVLALVSIGFLIFFIHHTAQSIQASSVIDRAAKGALGRIDALFPEQLGQAAGDKPALRLPSVEPFIITATEGGYLQTVDEDSLFSLAEKGHMVIRMEAFLGEFVLPGGPLAALWPPGAADEETVDAIRRALVLRAVSPPEEDLESYVTQLVDIAVKALSPGVNDPTTAKRCIDRMGEILVTLGNREMPDRVRTNDQGRVVFIARRTSFLRSVSLSFRQVRHYGAGNPDISVQILEVLGKVASLVPAGRVAPLIQEGRAVQDAARRQIETESELFRVDEAGRWMVRFSEPTTMPKVDGAAVGER